MRDLNGMSKNNLEVVYVGLCLTDAVCVTVDFYLASYTPDCYTTYCNVLGIWFKLTSVFLCVLSTVLCSGINNSPRGLLALPAQGRCMCLWQKPWRFEEVHSRRKRSGQSSARVQTASKNSFTKV